MKAPKVKIFSFLAVLCGIAVFASLQAYASPYYFLTTLQNQNNNVLLQTGDASTTLAKIYAKYPILATQFSAKAPTTTSASTTAAFAASFDAMLKDFFGETDPPVATSTVVTITSLSSDSLAPGAPITIFGTNFSRYGNTLTFNDEKVKNIPSATGAAIVTTVPKDVFGRVLVTVTDSKKEQSNSAAFLAVYANSIPPSIVKVPPTSPSVTDTITIQGTGFAKMNDIYTSIGILNNVHSTSSTTLSFKLSDIAGLSFYAGLPKQYMQHTTSIWLYVSNENGISKQSDPLTITI